METRVNKNYIIQFLLILLVVASAIIINNNVQISKLKRSNEAFQYTIENNNKIYEAKLLKYDTRLKTAQQAVQDLNNIVKETDKELKTVMNQKEEMYKKLSDLKNRKELFDKYEYAIMYDGKRTDLTYKQIKMGQDLMLQKGYNPNILFGIIMTESRATEKCKNTESTARGLGQFLKSTGKWVYEDLLNLGIYNHNYALNGDTNIKMMVAYLDYLLKTNNNNLYDAIQLYRGSFGQPKVTQSYCNSIDTFISMANTSVDRISRGMTSNTYKRNKK